MSIKPYYQDECVTLYHGDCTKILKQLETVDLIFADPPYFLSNDGITCSSGKMVSVNKGTWDQTTDKHKFNRKWIKLCYPLIKNNGSIWISGTLHNIYSIGMALEQENYKIINNITWQKTNPPPNLACRCFTHSTETVLWAKPNTRKHKHYFDYAAMKDENGGKQMKDVWTSSITPPKEKTEGKHPTQKPLFLLDRIVRCSSKEGDTVLDPFCGSGTTAIAAIKNNRKFIGIEQNEEFLKLTIKRIQKEKEIWQETLNNG